MCGICGFNWDDKILLQRMTDSIAHRGPDGYGYHVSDHMSMGHRRLAVLDLSSKGRQPMYNEDGSICIVYNGEVYNFRELRRILEGIGHSFSSNTDTEVVLRAYEEWGEEFLGRLNGFFSLGILDERKSILFLARDRVGIKPLYYFHSGGRFIFASEVKAIIECEDIGRVVNFDAINHFLRFRFNAMEETMIQGIKRMLPGHMGVYNYKNNEFVIKKYWGLPDKGGKNCDTLKCQETLLDALEDSVRSRLVSDVPIGIFLSGGIDSTTILALMKKNYGDEKIKTFSVGFDQDKIGNELGYASKVSRIFDTDHKEILISSDCIKELPDIVWHLDEPMSDPAVIPNYFLSREAKKEATVILTGDGADELFAGYDQHRFFMMGQKMRWIPQQIRRKLVEPAIRRIPLWALDIVYPYSSSTGREMFNRLGMMLGNAGKEDAASYMNIVSIFETEEIKRLMAIENGNTNSQLADNLDKRYFFGRKNKLDSILRMDFERYLPEDLLMKPDRMGMAHGLEVRVPFLDHRLAEAAFNFDPKMKLRRGKGKYILRKAVHGIVPNSIIRRRKQPFVVPLDIWFKDGIMGSYSEIVETGSLARAGLIKKDEARNIREKFNNSPMYYGRQMWSLQNLELWYRIFIQGASAKEIKV